MKAFVQKETGAVAVVFALLMSVFLGIIALVIDGGTLYLEKQKLRNIVDAAALAGAQELPATPERAVAKAIEAINLNEGDPNQFTITFSQNYNGITVRAEKTVALVFAEVLGFREADVDASAHVGLGALMSGQGAVPVGVEYTSPLTFGEIKKLKVEDATIGNFGALALAGPGANIYEEDFKNGYAQELRVNQIVNTQTGNLAGPTARAVNYRVAACPTSTYLNFPDDCPRVVLVPVFQSVVTQQNQVKSVKIVGFAKFFIEDSNASGQSVEIIGRFIEETDSGEISYSSPSYGAYGYKLTR